MQLPHNISFAGENIISNTLTLSNKNTYVHSGYYAGIVINSNCHSNVIEGSSGILITENCIGNHIKQSRDICLRKASYNIFEYSIVVRLGSS
jgi:hypothetical protein